MKKLSPALRITLVFFIISVFWIVFSDHMLNLFLNRISTDKLTFYQSVKGIVFVSFTSWVVYQISNKYLQQLNRQIVLLEKRNKEIEDNEKRYADLFEHSPMPMYVFDMKTLLFLDVNQAFLLKYGYTKEEFLKLNLLDIRPEEDRQPLLDDIRKRNIHEEPLLGKTLRHLKKNGEQIFVDVQSMVLNYNGIKARISMLNDLTKVIEAQNSLQKAYESVVHIEETERQYFAGEIHDGIAQNIVASKQVLSMLGEQNEVLKSQHMFNLLLETLDNTIKDCRNLIHNVRPKELYDNGLFDSLNTLQKRTNDAGIIKLDVDLNTNLDQLVQPGQRFHIYRIIQENINNTVKHAEASYAQLKINLEKNHCLVIDFLDNGKGIEPQVFQAESSFISLKNRVATLKGKLKVENNTNGSGARFHVEIPLETDSNII